MSRRTVHLELPPLDALEAQLLANLLETLAYQIFDAYYDDIYPLDDADPRPTPDDRTIDEYDASGHGCSVPTDSGNDTDPDPEF